MDARLEAEPEARLRNCLRLMRRFAGLGADGPASPSKTERPRSMSYILMDARPDYVPWRGLELGRLSDPFVGLSIGRRSGHGPPGSVKGSSVRRFLSSLCLSLLLTGPVLAQDTSPRLAQLHDSLHLTADQEGPWRDYVAATAPSPQALARHRATTQLLPQLPTPRRVALIEATMTADNADLHRQGLAVIAFYDRLSPDQQRAFDRATVPEAGDRSSSEPQRGSTGGRLNMPPPPNP